MILHRGRGCCTSLCCFCAQSDPWFAGSLYDKGNRTATMASQGLTPAFPLLSSCWLGAPASVHCSHTQKPCPTEDVLFYNAACRHPLLRGEGSSPVAVLELSAQPGARVCLTGSCNLSRWGEHFGHTCMWWVARRKGLVLGLVPWVGIQKLFCCSFAP